MTRVVGRRFQCSAVLKYMIVSLSRQREWSQGAAFKRDLESMGMANSSISLQEARPEQALRAWIVHRRRSPTFSCLSPDVSLLIRLLGIFGLLWKGGSSALGRCLRLQPPLGLELVASSNVLSQVREQLASSLVS